MRPGGVVAFVTSRYTMDAKDSTVRRYLAQRAELLGAIRLPNDAFKKNAGAEVVSLSLIHISDSRPEAEPAAGEISGQVRQDEENLPEGTPAHLFIPQIVLCTGGGVRTLGVDHQLLMERVLVKAGSSSEKPCPFLPAPRELCCHLLRHLCI